MSASPQEVRDLLRRCRAVGARMRALKTGGVQVRLPNTDRIVHIPPMAGPSFRDRRSLKNLEMQLRAAGLEELEEQTKNGAEVKRRNKIASDRAATKPIGGPKVVRPTKASGVCDTDIAWVTTPASEPQSCWMRITPELAGVLLTEKHNRFNRPWVPSHGSTLQDAIQHGQWRITHQGIAIDTNGIMQDGRHRCQAIADSGVAVVMPVSIGMDPENFMSVDENLARRAMDLIAREGQPGANRIAAMIKLIEAWLRDDELSVNTRHRRKITNSTSYNMWQTERDQLIVAADVGKRVRKGCQGINAGAAGAAHYLISSANGWDSINVDGFFSGLETGYYDSSRRALVHNDPRIALRQLMINRKLKRQRTSTLDHLRHLIVCWNKVVTDDRTGFAQSRENMILPDIEVCLDSDPMPELLLDSFDG